MITCYRHLVCFSLIQIKYQLTKIGSKKEKKIRLICWSVLLLLFFGFFDLNLDFYFQFQFFSPFPHPPFKQQTSTDNPMIIYCYDHFVVEWFKINCCWHLKADHIGLFSHCDSMFDVFLLPLTFPFHFSKKNFLLFILLASHIRLLRNRTN